MIFLISLLILLSSPLNAGYDSFRYLYSRRHQAMFAKEKGSRGCFYRPNRDFAGAPSFPCMKGKGVRRIFVIGNSIAKLVAPPIINPDPTLEIIQCGMGGYDSSRDAEILDEILLYQPDMVLILTGENEGIPKPSLKIIFKSLIAPSNDSLPFDLNTLLLSYREKNLANELYRNLTAMVQRAKASKIKTLLCTLPLNLELPPWGAGPTNDPQYVLGRLRLDQGRTLEAANLFRGVLQNHKNDPHVLFFLGKTLKRLHDVSAKSYLSRSVEFSGLGRMTHQRNDVIRKVASEQNIGVVDLEMAFEQLAGSNPVGLDFLFNGSHWKKNLIPAVFDDIFKSPIVTRDIGKTHLWEHAPYPKDPKDHPDFLLAAAIKDWIEASRTLIPLHFSEKTLAYLEAGLRGRMELLEQSETVLALAEKSIEMDPFWFGSGAQLAQFSAPITAHLAELARRNGNLKLAEKIFNKSLNADPQFAPAYWGRGLARWSSQQKDAAQADFKQLEHLGDYPETSIFTRQLSPETLLSEIRRRWTSVYQEGEESQNTYELSNDLLHYYQCQAQKQNDPAPCGKLRGIYNHMRDPLNSACQERFQLNRFMSLSLEEGKEREAAASCVELISNGFGELSLFPNKTEQACKRLASAYKAQYAPVCFELTWGGWLNPGFTPNDFLILCETALYPSHARSCNLLRDPWQYHDCLDQAEAFASLKERRPPKSCGPLISQMASHYLPEP